jgi:hypothetical protein
MRKRTIKRIAKELGKLALALAVEFSSLLTLLYAVELRDKGFTAGYVFLIAVSFGCFISVFKILCDRKGSR